MAFLIRQSAGAMRAIGILLIFLLASACVTQSAYAQADGDAPVQLNFDNSDLNEVINYVAEILGIRFIVDPQVAGRVNIRMDTPIKKRDLYAVFETILRMNNATIIKGVSISQIVPIAAGVKLPIGVYDYSEFVGKGIQQEPSKAGTPAAPPGAAAPPAAPPAAAAPVPSPMPVPPIKSPRDTELFSDGELAIHIVPIEFLPADDIKTMLTPFMSNGGAMVCYPKANLLIITDFKDNIRRLRQIIQALDGRVFDSTYIDLIKIKYYQVKDVAEDLGKVIAGSAKDVNVGITIIPIERLNSILAVANSQRGLEKVHTWLDRLDTPQGRSQQTFVYPVQNSTANNIATILTQLYSSSGAAATPTAQSQTRQPLTTQRTQQQTQNQPQQLGPRLSGSLDLGGAAAGGPTGEIKIIVDELNNSLVIQATEPDFEYILKTIHLLDVLPRQVLVEAKIFEVGLTDELSMGVQWYFENKGGVAASGTGTSATAAARSDITTDASIGAAKIGQIAASTVFQVFNNKQLAANLVALRNKTTVKALEAPSIIAMDGKEAKIEVGEEVPVSTSTLSTSMQVAANQSFFNSIQYRPTGVILVLNARITASGMVTMEIAQEVSQVSGGEALTPKVSKSAVSTSVVLRDGEGVAIAGVIRENVSVNKTRVPGLGDIPLLGYLFGNSSRSLTRTEIIVLITPTVIKGPDQYRDITSEWEGQFKDVNRMMRNLQRESARNVTQWKKQLEEEIRKEEERRNKQSDRQNTKSSDPQDFPPPPSNPATAVPPEAANKPETPVRKEDAKPITPEPGKGTPPVPPAAPSPTVKPPQDAAPAAAPEVAPAGRDTAMFYDTSR